MKKKILAFAVDMLQLKYTKDISRNNHPVKQRNTTQHAQRYLYRYADDLNSLSYYRNCLSSQRRD